jgi:tetratricopeptide (TPR) repeat protein
LAATAFASGEYEEAGQRYRHALDLYADLDDPRGIADALQGIAHLARLAGNLSTARDGFKQASTIYGRLGDELGCANSLWGIGLVASADNDNLAAATCWRQALEIFERIGAPEVRSVRMALRSLAGESSDESDTGGHSR